MVTKTINKQLFYFIFFLKQTKLLKNEHFKMSGFKDTLSDLPDDYDSDEIEDEEIGDEDEETEDRIPNDQTHPNQRFIESERQTVSNIFEGIHNFICGGFSSDTNRRSTLLLSFGGYIPFMTFSEQLQVATNNSIDSEESEEEKRKRKRLRKDLLIKQQEIDETLKLQEKRRKENNHSSEEIMEKITCKICLDNDVSLLLVDCGHTVCHGCYNMLIEKMGNKCHICKASIEKKPIKIFL